MVKSKTEILEEFGFTYKKSGVHTKRTMMSNDLRTLLEYIPEETASLEDYRRCIIEDNCLGKRSGVTRKLSADYLANLYILNKNILIFKAFYYFWKRDDSSHEQLCLLSSYVRDGVLRDSFDYIKNLPKGSISVKKDYEENINEQHPGRFSTGSIQSLVRNLLSTWKQSGHLEGRINKKRCKLSPTLGAVAFSAFLSFISGERGIILFESEYFKLLECSRERAIDLMIQASNRGWLVFKQLREVVEISFPNLINNEDMELIREQNRPVN